MTKPSETLYSAAKKPVIETFTGKEFDPYNPVFDIRDVAHGLSNKCRFNGQCSHFYSVAEHSVLVVRILQRLGCREHMREGLMHDGNEAYLPDVPSPYKQLLPDLKRLEDQVDASVRRHWGLPPKKSDAVTWADCVAVMIEAIDLLPSGGKGPLWEPMAPYLEPAQRLRAKGLYVEGMFPREAELQFLAVYRNLFGDENG